MNSYDSTRNSNGAAIAGTTVTSSTPPTSSGEGSARAPRSPNSSAARGAKSSSAQRAISPAQSSHRSGIPSPTGPKVASSHATTSRCVTSLKGMRLCSTPGTSTRRQAVPAAKSPCVVPAALPPAAASACRAVSCSLANSHAPVSSSRLRGLPGETSLEMVEMAMVAAISSCACA